MSNSNWIPNDFGTKPNQLTEDWCRKNLQAKGYEIREDTTAVEFVVAKCSNGSDAMVAFNKSRPSQKDFPRCFVSNFYVEHIKTVDDLRTLVLALGFGNDVPWMKEGLSENTKAKQEISSPDSCKCFACGCEIPADQTACDQCHNEWMESEFGLQS